MQISQMPKQRDGRQELPRGHESEYWQRVYAVSANSAAIHNALPISSDNQVGREDTPVPSLDCAFPAVAFHDFSGCDEFG